MLFRLRWEDDDKADQQAFIRTLNLDWKPVSPDEKLRFRAELIAASPSVKEAAFDTEAFFKVRFNPASQLL